MGIFEKEIWQLTWSKLVNLYQHDSFSKQKFNQSIFGEKNQGRKNEESFSIGKKKKVTAPKPKLDLGFGRTLLLTVLLLLLFFHRHPSGWGMFPGQPWYHPTVQLHHGFLRKAVGDFLMVLLTIPTNKLPCCGGTIWLSHRCSGGSVDTVPA